MRTAGRTVVFSGLTVALALSSLLLFPQDFLKSMGYGGMAAVLVAMLAALTVLPALLAVLGPRINALRMPLPRLGSPQPVHQRVDIGRRGWERLTRSVMRRPVVYLLVTVGRPARPGHPVPAGATSAASTSGCCRTGPRAAPWPSGSPTTSRAAASAPIVAVVDGRQPGAASRRTSTP